MMSGSKVLAAGAAREVSLRERLNGSGHERALQIFMIVVLAHWAEHLSQAVQIYFLGWPPAEARGVLGIWMPWLIEWELLHYAYALVMLLGIWYLRPGFQGLSHRWWTVALAIQFWHHIEHALLQMQALIGQNLFNSPVPMSILQLWIPRVELHLFYNTIVFIPMLIAMYYHMFPAVPAPNARCTCAVRRSMSAA